MSFRSLARIRSWLAELADFRVRGSIRVLDPALGLMFVALCVLGVWLYVHSGRYTKPSEVTQLQEGAAPLTPPLTGPTAPAEPAPRGQEIRPPQTTRSRPGQLATLGSANQTKEIDRVRGTNARLAAAMLLTVKRVYVDPLGDDSFSQQLREKLIGSLRASNRFEVVSNRDDADAVFRGSAKKVLKPGSNSSVLLELVNANGYVIWSLSSQKSGSTLSSNADDAAVARAETLIQFRGGRRQETLFRPCHQSSGFILKCVAASSWCVRVRGPRHSCLCAGYQSADPRTNYPDTPS